MLKKLHSGALPSRSRYRLNSCRKYSATLHAPLLNEVSANIPLFPSLTIADLVMADAVFRTLSSMSEPLGAEIKSRLPCVSACLVVCAVSEFAASNKISKWSRIYHVFVQHSTECTNFSEWRDPHSKLVITSVITCISTAAVFSAAKFCCLVIVYISAFYICCSPHLRSSYRMISFFFALLAWHRLTSANTSWTVIQSPSYNESVVVTTWETVQRIISLLASPEIMWSDRQLDVNVIKTICREIRIPDIRRSEGPRFPAHSGSSFKNIEI